MCNSYVTYDWSVLFDYHMLPMLLTLLNKSTRPLSPLSYFGDNKTREKMEKNYIYKLSKENVGHLGFFAFGLLIQMQSISQTMFVLTVLQWEYKTKKRVIIYRKMG